MGTVVFALAAIIGAVSGADEFKVKRQEVFEFAQKPQVTRQGDRVTIRFETKGFCDVTVALEDETGTIVRHLASGVLGANAPEPFQKDSKKQTIVWDGKDDQGTYIDDTDALTVRVSLGLDPRFERTLYWHAKKRLSGRIVRIGADEDGVYVYQAGFGDDIRMYDHEGNYLHTIYPFAADKVERVKGLPWRSYPDGTKVPAKRAYFLSTLLTGRESGGVESTRVIISEASAMTVRDGRIALVGLRLNRLATDGTSGGLNVWGPYVDFPPRVYRWPKQPFSLAFSPDGKYLYLAGYTYAVRSASPHPNRMWVHGVLRMEYGKEEQPKVFIGHLHERGTDNQHFDQAAAVAVDSDGRLYIADHCNNRVQIYTAAGKYLKTLPVKGPAQIAIHHKTGEVYVFSWGVPRQRGLAGQSVRPLLSRFGPYPDLEPRAAYALPVRIGQHPSHGWRTSLAPSAALDSWVDPPVVWLYPGGERRGTRLHSGWVVAGCEMGFHPFLDTAGRMGATGTDGVLLLKAVEGKLEQIQDFAVKAARSPIRLWSNSYGRQRLYADHRRNRFYLAEGDCGVGKAFSSILVIDPETGRMREEQLPFSASDMAMGPDGLMYLRTGKLVGRYNPETWKEVPFDYGEDREPSYSYDARVTGLSGAMRLPSTKTSPSWHHGGMDINAKGDILITCFNPHAKKIVTRKGSEDRFKEPMKPFETRLYPGRWASGHELQIFDPYGRLKHRDLLKGQPRIVAGAGLDNRGDVYANISASVMWDGKPYYKVVGHRFDQVGTLVKFTPGEGRFLMAPGKGTPIPLQAVPKRPPDLAGFWVEGAHWFYPGVGRSQWGMDCSCSNSRFDLDHFGRSFAPEYDRFSVAVLDSNGNLIVRIGRYGNVEDGLPQMKRGGPPSPRPLGGDEVALFDAAYLGVLTDSRLYIADAGNARIVSVKLDYYATERVALKDVPDTGRS